VSENTYKVTSCTDASVVYTRHVSMLRPYRLRPEDDPAAIAAADVREFVVDRIIDHSCPTRNKRTWDFRVRWVGYPDPSDDRWLPWESVRPLAALDAYAREHPELKL
jgi:hypothetical protein